MASFAETLAGDEIEGRTGIGSDSINRALCAAKVAPVVEARGWRKVTRRALGLTGKGYALVRSAAALAA